VKRRDFITLLGGAAVAWPLAARAQQPEGVRRMGVLLSLAADDPQSQARVAALLQGLQQFGWADGRNIRIDYRWGAGNAESMRRYSAELIALAPDVVLAGGSEAVAAFQHATRDVPILFVNVIDPVGAGYVDSLSRPGRNATGFALFEYSISPKWLELLKEIASGVTRVAVIRDAAIPSGIGQFGAIQGVASSFGVEVSPLGIDRRVQIVTLATRYLLPTVYFHDQRQLFYSFSLEEAVPDDHLVRKIAAVLDLSWVHAELAPHYPNNGRPLD
jgi:ABC-type uncharacterized transport system substrate-binding protein